MLPLDQHLQYLTSVVYFAGVRIAMRGWRHGSKGVKYMRPMHCCNPPTSGGVWIPNEPTHVNGV